MKHLSEIERELQRIIEKDEQTTPLYPFEEVWEDIKDKLILDQTTKKD